jgi:hypothetical protein
MPSRSTLECDEAVPFIAYVHSREPDPPPEGDRRKQPWEPNWKMWRWIVGAVVAGYCATKAGNAAGLVLMIVAFGLGCLAIDEALPRGDGMREWRQ